MDRPPLSLVVVASEKELQKMVSALRSLSRKVPLRLLFATQAIEGPAAFTRMKEQTGKLDACFFHSRFTAVGKEPYSEILGKTIKRKYSDTPIIGFGKKSKAGTRGKHYHEFLETDDEIDPKELLQLLYRIQDGDIHTTKTKKEYRRMSTDDEALSQNGAAAVKAQTESHESRAFPRNASFRKAAWTGIYSQPSSPGSPYYNNGGFRSESPPAMYASQPPPTFASGPSTPSGMRSPRGYNPTAQLIVNGSPNAELIHQLSQELEKLKGLIYEKKARESAFPEPSHQVTALE